MIRIGGTYRFVQQDCAGMHVPGMHELRGKLVRVIEPYDCLSCWWVRCQESGKEFQVFADELVDESPMLGQCEDHGQLFAVGECIVALETLNDDVRAGDSFRVSAHNRDGSIDITLFRHYPKGVASLDVLVGRYNPACFRKA